MKRVIIIGEDYERTLPLLKALEERKVRTVMWNVSKGCLSPTSIPEDAIYFCRQSPSCSARNHGGSIPYVRNLLWWLNYHGRTVVNGQATLEMEVSKSSQMTLLHSLGVNIPRTRLVLTTQQLWAELRYMPNAYPVIIKPDTGGSGNHVSAFENGRAAAYDVQYGNTQRAEECTWIVQEHINTFSNDPAVMRSILRFEIVDGKVLYVMQIRAPVTEFKLCPCDPKFESIFSKLEFRIIKDPLTIPCFKDNQAAYNTFCGKLERVWQHVGAMVGSAEAFLPVAMADDYEGRHYSEESQIAPNEPVVFEINFNSNYNRVAEGLAGISGVDAVADMLRDMTLPRPSPTIVPSPILWSVEDLLELP